MSWWGWVIAGAILLGAELAFVNAQFYLVFVGSAAIVVGMRNRHDSGDSRRGRSGPCSRSWRWSRWSRSAAAFTTGCAVTHPALIPDPPVA